jgi:GATA-binding protein
MSLARTATPTAIASPAFTMDPTTTEHDFRFPRRPAGYGLGPNSRTNHHHHQTQAQSQSQSQSQTQPNPQHAFNQRPRGNNNNARFGPRELYADSQAFAGQAATSRMLGPALFPLLQSADGGSNESLDNLQQDDPLATQVWKFFARTKQELPHQDRMENLTWRMMAVGMRKHKQQMQQKRYARIKTFHMLFL